MNVEAVDEGEEEQIEIVAELAMNHGGNRATRPSMKGTRPSMKGVGDVLGMLMKLPNGNLQAAADKNYDSEETERLVAFSINITI